ncbi:NXPE family member 4-like [Glandiceps talaboti]
MRCTHGEYADDDSNKLSRLDSNGRKDQRLLRKSNIVNVVLDTFDANGRKRLSGGDFYFAVMVNAEKRKATAGRVVDHSNGTYNVYFYAGWSGHANITIILRHPGEEVDWIQRVVRPQERRVRWIGNFKDGKKQENSACYVYGGTTWKDKCEYRNENSLGSTLFLCDKPKNLTCDKIVTTHSEIPSMGTYIRKLLSSEKRYLFSSNLFFNLIQLFEMFDKTWKEDTDASQVVNITRPSCGPDLPIPTSDGFWESDNKWTSLVCAARHWSTDEAIGCLEGKNVYLLGDSTLRQWHEAVTVLFNERVTTHHMRRGWTNTKYNTSVIFRFHAIVIGSRTFNLRDQIFESDFINTLGTDDCNIIIVLSLSYHFTSWTQKSYIERLLHVRQAILRLKTLCPDIIVIIKGSHPREHKTQESHIHSSDWTLYTMNQTLRRVFEGLGVCFIDIYDMSLAHFAENNVHMPMKTVIRQQVDLLLSYICPVTV